MKFDEFLGLISYGKCVHCIVRIWFDDCLHNGRAYWCYALFEFMYFANRLDHWNVTLWRTVLAVQFAAIWNDYAELVIFDLILRPLAE